MGTYRISGIWKPESAITHYAIHKIENGVIQRSKKFTKAQAISLVENNQNTVTTYIWNYKTAKWNIGEDVHVVDDPAGKYLRSNADNKVTDNLGHLIDYDWVDN